MVVQDTGIWADNNDILVYIKLSSCFKIPFTENKTLLKYVPFNKSPLSFGNMNAILLRGRAGLFTTQVKYVYS
jgi:hypothetical protein